MLFNQKELTEQKNDLITRAEDTVNKAKSEKRELTDEEMAELSEIRDNVRKITEKLKINEDMDSMDEKHQSKNQYQLTKMESTTCVKKTRRSNKHKTKLVLLKITFEASWFMNVPVN